MKIIQISFVYLQTYGPIFLLQRESKGCFQEQGTAYSKKKKHTKLIPGYLFYNAEHQVREANEDKVPAAYKQTESKKLMQHAHSQQPHSHK